MLEYNNELLESVLINATELESSVFICPKDNNYAASYTKLLETIVNNFHEQKNTIMPVPEANGDKQINTMIESNKKVLRKKIDIPRYTPFFYTKKVSINSFYVESREYHGEVISIEDGGKFIAKLVNITDNKDVLQAEFNNSDIDEKDSSLLRVGALFIWIIGKEEYNGTQKKISQLVFRRTSSWTKRDIKRIEEIGKNRAAAIRALFTEDDTSSI